jgi:hypothetical protein
MIISLSRNWTEILLGRSNAFFLCSGFFQIIFLKEINIHIYILCCLVGCVTQFASIYHRHFVLPLA